MAWIEGGEFTMGTDSDLGWPDEKPAHRVRVDGFWIDENEVTNAQFAAFVAATGYVTTAEKAPEPTRSSASRRRARRRRRRRSSSPARWCSTHRRTRSTCRTSPQWWQWTPGASWRHPEGAGQRHRRQGRPSGRPRLLGRRRRLREVGRQATADRGRVGVRRPRRA